MPDWIQSLIDSGIASIRDLANATASRLTSVWGVITGFFTSVGRAETLLRTRVTAWVAAQIRHAQSVALTLKWLTLTYLPRKIAQAVTALRTWTGNLIQQVRNEAASLIADLRRWAVSALNALISDVTKLRNWALAQFNAAVARLAKIEHVVFGVLSTPERIVAYIGTAMASWLLKYVMDHLDAILEYIWRNRKPFYTRGTAILEDIISKLI